MRIFTVLGCRRYDYYPGGMLMPGRTFQSGSASYRYGFNGQEKSDEIAPNTTTATFWEYDSRIVRRWNRDPLPVFGLSEYATFSNNPVWMTDVLGDSSIFGTKGEKIYYDKKDKDLRVFMKDGDKLTLLGTLGKQINVDVILKNVLQNDRSDMVNSPSSKLSWFQNVLPGNKWDLKANEKTIFGVAWSYDETQKGKPKTGFTFNFNSTLNLEFANAADVGNFHAGYTGTYANIPVAIQRMFAGAGEKAKNAVDTDGKNFWGNSILRPPFGDRKPDYFWNKLGMVAADYDKKINATINAKPHYDILPTYKDATQLRSPLIPR